MSVLEVCSTPKNVRRYMRKPKSVLISVVRDLERRVDWPEADTCGASKRQLAEYAIFLDMLMPE